MFYLSLLHPFPPPCWACDAEPFKICKLLKAFPHILETIFFFLMGLFLAVFSSLLALLCSYALQANLHRSSLYFSTFRYSLVSVHHQQPWIILFLFSGLVSILWSIYLKSKTGNVVMVSFLTGPWAGLCLIINILLLHLDANEAGWMSMLGIDVCDIVLEWDVVVLRTRAPSRGWYCWHGWHDELVTWIVSRKSQCIILFDRSGNGWVELKMDVYLRIFVGRLHTLLFLQMSQGL